jgi:hypothetical protein
VKRAKLRPKVKKYIAFHPNTGLFLGVHKGRCFFSFGDTGGQSEVPLFSSLKECEEFLTHFDAPPEFLSLFSFREVMVFEEIRFMPRDQIVELGYPTWTNIPPEYYSRFFH